MRKVLFILFSISILTGCGSPYPFDTYNEGYELQHEVDELEIEGEMYDTYKEALYDSYSETASAELQEFDDDYGNSNYSSSSSGCPNGCTYHKDGCDIKGNISINTGERIYHIPWQEFYSVTKISPDYGERWFCTEEEARQNGWRKSKQ